jgi:hypothetical protein
VADTETTDAERREMLRAGEDAKAYTALLDADPEMHRHIEQSTEDVAMEVEAGRMRAHLTHGDRSVESVNDPHRLLAITLEEVGEVAKALNEGALGNTSILETIARTRAELIDVLVCATAWVATIDAAEREGADW